MPVWPGAAETRSALDQRGQPSSVQVGEVALVVLVVALHAVDDAVAQTCRETSKIWRVVALTDQRIIACRWGGLVGC